MFNKFIKIFIKDADKTDNPKVREKYGSFSGFVGIILNVMLCATKIITGFLTGAISIVSDGINNLSDAGSSIVTMLGFKLSSKKPDKEHPFGHGRMEYFAGLAVSVIIIIVAVQLFINSLKKVISGELLEFPSEKLLIITIAVLSLSILTKLWLAFFNRYVAKKINSVANKATAADSISDCIATTVVLICAILSKYVNDIPLDGIAGILVSVFIAWQGLSSLKDIADLLIGSAPDPELVKEVTDFALNFDKKKIIGVHDLMINDYGPGRKLIILHAEVPCHGDVMKLHDAIDNLERALQHKFGCLAVIHMDPVDNESERVKQLRELTRAIVKDLDPDFDIHDFRMNEGETHANLIFDLVITHESSYSIKEIRNFVTTRLKAAEPKCHAIMKIEYSFT